MSTTHQPDLLGHRTTNKARVVLARVLVLPASALTIFSVYAAVDLATTTYIESEVLIAQAITVAAGLLAVLAWIGVIALHKSARRDLRPGPQHLMPPH